MLFPKLKLCSSSVFPICTSVPSITPTRLISQNQMSCECEVQSLMARGFPSVRLVQDSRQRESPPPDTPCHVDSRGVKCTSRTVVHMGAKCCVTAGQFTHLTCTVALSRFCNVELLELAYSCQVQAVQDALQWCIITSANTLHSFSHLTEHACAD